MLPKINTAQILKRTNILLDMRVLGLLAFGVIVVLVSWSGLKVLQTNFELERKITSLRQREAIQILENDNLRLQNTYLATDQYLELAARRQFGKAAPGERIYLVPRDVALARTVVPPQAVSAGPKAPVPPKPKYHQNFDAWIHFLLHRNV